MTQQHAWSSQKPSQRNVVVGSLEDLANWTKHSVEISQFVMNEPVTSINVESVDPSKYLSGNSVSITKLTVNATFAFHVKLIKVPDAESVYLCTIRERYPSIVQDASVLIPTVIDLVDSSTGAVLNYLHITRWTSHLGTLADIIVLLWTTRHHVDLDKLLRDFGRFLHAFHARYPKLHHNDMNPSNVLIVEFPANRVPPTFVLVDCAGLDDEVGDDYASFLLSMDVLAEGGFGPEFKTLALEAFSAGYGD